MKRYAHKENVVALFKTRGLWRSRKMHIESSSIGPHVSLVNSITESEI